MADKKISDLTATTSLAAGDLLLVELAGGNSRKITAANAGLGFRGALVKKTADATTINATAGHNITFDAEEYDTDSIHDNVTNNTRLTVPSGVTKVRLRGQFYISGGTAGNGTFKVLTIAKNGSFTYAGVPNLLIEATSGSAAGQVSSPVLVVTAGDYFELNLTEESDTSITIEADFTWFAMEIIG